MTEENRRAPNYRGRQVQVKLAGRVVWADPELVPLLLALNHSGLKTRSHCVGHKTGRPWVVIRMDNVETVEIRNHGEYRELLIAWEAVITPLKGNDNVFGERIG